MVRREIAILFVEDSESDVKLTVRELQRQGFAPVWERVEDSARLATALRDRRWDLVVSDSSIAGLALTQAREITRTLTPGTPFVVMSGAPQRSELTGIDGYASKGDPHALGEILARHLAWRDDAVAKLVLGAQDAEARRIARALHDRLGLHLGTALRALDEDRHGDARSALAEAIRATRDVSTELWPAVLDDLGLSSALRWLVDRHRDRLGGVVRADVAEIERPAREIEIACYWITQEALTNAARHAGAQLVTVGLCAVAGEIRLTIDDDGVGFDPELAWQHATAGKSLGLLTMRERATLAGGAFALSSRPGGGTCVRATFWMDHAADPDR